MRIGNAGRNTHGIGQALVSERASLALGEKMETPDPLLERVAPVLAAVPDAVAIVLGGSRARGAARSASGYDLGLCFRESAGLDVGCLLAAVKDLVDDPSDAALTEAA